MKHENMEDNSENPNITFPELQPFGKLQLCTVILEITRKLVIESEHQVLNFKEVQFIVKNTSHAGKKQVLTYFII